MRDYPFKEIEARWRERWEQMKLYETPLHPRKKLYILEMFAYPSGDIHMGHFRNYTIGDVIVRFKKMQGYDILHPFGWDAFGLPAEEAAIKRGVHPREWTLGNIRVSQSTLRQMGISYDWSREIITCLPEYYKWNQWIFLTLYRKGLAYRAEASVNWCPGCKTVLANEQVIAGQCWRCHREVTTRQLEQWFFRITAYAERLLEGLDRLPHWPENVKTMQRNWIGKSIGTEIDFPLEGGNQILRVFTTRPDTIFGVTFVVLSPEHPLAKKVAMGTPYEATVRDYIHRAAAKPEFERTAETTEKDGVFTGRYAINPFSGEKVQLWVADYVLATYGTGIVMGVPAHDERDFHFARNYGIPIRVVIQPPGQSLEPDTMQHAYINPGVMVNSGPFSGLPSEEGIEKTTAYAEAKGFGRRKVNFRLRDWLVSRQRYWGTPIPMIHCEPCGIVPVPETDLPVLLPEGEIDFIPKGRSPLADSKAFMDVRCPQCRGPAQRDPDTMDTFVDSSWYHLRYTDARNPREPFSKDSAKQWMPVDLYIGGIEHATGHLLYFRFITKVLHDEGWLPYDEPVVRLFNHGMVLDEQGEVMSKSKGNVVSPAHLFEGHGVDIPRIALLFAAPSGKEIRWTEKGMTGAKRFLNRVYRLFDHAESLRDLPRATRFRSEELSTDEQRLYRKLHQTIKAVTEDIETLEFNTAIAAMMELLNLYETTSTVSPAFKAYFLRILAKLLAPFAPHLAEELWEKIDGKSESIFRTPWIEYDPTAVEVERVEVVIQVDGKVRDKIEVPVNSPEGELKSQVLTREKVIKHLAGRSPKNFIIVPNRLVNVVTR